MNTDARPVAPGSRASLSQRIGLVLGPVLFILCLLWTDGPLDAAQRKVAAITALTATWWMTVAIPIGATSLIPAALLPLLGVMGAREVGPRYMHDLVFLFIGAFVIALGLERWNVHRRMALWIIARVGTRPHRLVLGFMAASAFLSCWINNTSTTLLMLPIGVAVITSVTGSKPGDRDPFALAMLLGMAYSASVGGMATPVGTVPNQVFLGIMADRFPDAPAVSFGQWAIAWGPVVLLFLPLGWLLLTRVVLRVPTRSERGSEVIESERKALGAMSRPEKMMAAVFGATAFLWVTRAGLDLGFVRIPGWVTLVVPDGVEQPGRYVTDATVATCMAVLCFLVPVDRKRGVFLMDWKTASKMPWEVLLLIGAGFAIAGAFGETGLDRVIGDSLGPLLRDMSPLMMVAGVVVLMTALTEITSNTATTVVLLPVLGQAAVAADVSPMLFMAPATIAASAAFMLPVATPPNAVVFASRRVAAPSMARVGFFMNMLLALLIVVVFHFWGRRVLDVGDHSPAWAQTEETSEVLPEADQDVGQGIDATTR